MSDRMSVSEAREWLPMAESHDVNANISRLLRTAISQAEQIERLQNALAHFEYDKEARQEGLILPGDMEPPA